MTVRLEVNTLIYFSDPGECYVLVVVRNATGSRREWTLVARMVPWLDLAMLGGSRLTGRHPKP